MTDNGKEPKLIFKAELVGNNIKTTLNSKHLGILALISKRLDYEITELLALEKAKNEHDHTNSKVVVPNTKMSNIITRLRGK